jgi:HSP20 family protein
VKQEQIMTIYLSPYRRMAAMREAMNRLVEENLPEVSTSEREMALAVDVLAGEEGYTLRALVPGLEAEDLEIEIINNTVTIRGEFKCEEDQGGKYLTCELPNGRFSRVITLPVAVDSTKAEANLKNGVLKLYIPKAESHRPKSIKVSAG